MPPAGHWRLQRQAGRARLLEALSAGLGRHGPPRAHRAFVCSLLRSRVRAAPSPGRLVQRWVAVSVSCSPLPLTPALPPGHSGSGPSSRPELVWMPLGLNLGACEPVHDPASRAWVCSGRPRGPAASHPRGLQLGSLCSYLQAALICWAWGPGLPADPHRAASPSLKVHRCCNLGTRGSPVAYRYVRHGRFHLGRQSQGGRGRKVGGEHGALYWVRLRPGLGPESCLFPSSYTCEFLL